MRLNDGFARPVCNCVLIFFMTCVLAGLAVENQSANAQSATVEHGPALATASEARRVPDNVTHVSGFVLPDAPAPALEPDTMLAGESSSLRPDSAVANLSSDSWSFGVTPNSSERVPLDQCPTDTTGARECRVQWRQLLITSDVFNGFLNAGNLYSGYWYRWETTHGKWFQRWFDSDLGWDWNHWTDGNPALDQYVGHPLMGSITNYIWIQNDPRGATVQIGEPGYWKSRMRATAFSAVYHFEWKFGPFGEAGVGHIGDHGSHVVNGKWRNDTGVVELV